MKPRSFYDFAAHRHEGTRMHVLCGPPDPWGGRAITAWAERLAGGARFDPRCRSLIELSAVLDALYQRCRR